MDQILLLGPKNYSNSNRWHTTWLDGSVGINCKIKDVESRYNLAHMATLPHWVQFYLVFVSHSKCSMTMLFHFVCVS